MTCFMVGQSQNLYMTSSLLFQLEVEYMWQLSVLSMCFLACVLVSLLLFEFSELYMHPSLLGHLLQVCDWHSLIPRCLINLVH